MKKSIFAVALILGATSSTLAQDKQYTPVSGDWALGIDATPFLNYMGNLIGGNDGNVAPTWTFLTTNQQITGKYFASDDMAYRGSLRIGFSSASGSEMITETGSAAPTYPALGTEVEDTYKNGGMDIGLSGGLEWRKGSGRLVGFYGAELGVAFSSSSSTYTYGNAIVAADNNVNAITSDHGSNMTNDSYGFDARVISDKSGMTTAFGLRGFIGAEYFILPKMSIGGEFGWGLGLMSMGAGSKEIESTDGTTVGTQITEVTGGSAFGFDTNINNTLFGSAGSLRLTFHF
jgi:hypothetical protein